MSSSFQASAPGNNAGTLAPWHLSEDPWSLAITRLFSGNGPAFPAWLDHRLPVSHMQFICKRVSTSALRDWSTLIRVAFSICPLLCLESLNSSKDHQTIQKTKLLDESDIPHSTVFPINCDLSHRSTMVNLEEWTVKANDAMEIALFTKAEEGQTQIGRLCKFKPAWTYPIVGDEETIFGYKNLKITLRFNASDMRPHLSSTKSAKLPEELETGDIEVEDIHDLFNGFLPQCKHTPFSFLPITLLHKLTRCSCIRHKDRLRPSS